MKEWKKYEKIVKDYLKSNGIKYIKDSVGPFRSRPDFYLPDMKVYLQVKSGFQRGDMMHVCFTKSILDLVQDDKKTILITAPAGRKYPITDFVYGNLLLDAVLPIDELDRIKTIAYSPKERYIHSLFDMMINRGLFGEDFIGYQDAYKFLMWLDLTKNYNIHNLTYWARIVEHKRPNIACVRQRLEEFESFGLLKKAVVGRQVNYEVVDKEKIWMIFIAACFSKEMKTNKISIKESIESIYSNI